MHTNMLVHMYVHTYHTYTHNTYTHRHIDVSNTSAAFYSHVPCKYAWYTSTVHTTHMIVHRIYRLSPFFAGTVVKYWVNRQCHCKDTGADSGGLLSLVYCYGFTLGYLLWCVPMSYCNLLFYLLNIILQGVALQYFQCSDLCPQSMQTRLLLLKVQLPFDYILR